MFSNNYISTIVDRQLPDFIRSDHPVFVALLKRYYEYLESQDKTLYENKRLFDYFDVDTTRNDLVTYFKNKIIPNFPEESELSTEKLIKAARDFYSKKGTPDSLKFLFRVLYGQEIEVYLLKQDILRASDGKWVLPQALRLSISDTLTIIPSGNVDIKVGSANTVNANGLNLVSTQVVANSFIRVGAERRKVVSVNTFGDYLTVEVPFSSTYNGARLYAVTPSEYEDFDFNLIERCLGYGSDSRATCIIESAVKSVDKETGKEIVEVYISNLRKPLTVNEDLIVEYKDQNGDVKTFSSKIISLISNIRLSRNRLGVVQSGSKYAEGDPVVFYGGLNIDSPEAVKAVATVKEVSTGSIRSVLLNGFGYYFREHPNSVVKIFSTTGSGANVIVTGIFRDGINQVKQAIANTVLTYNVVNSGASSYNINGNTNPTLYFYRGLTYTLNVNASGHPFWVQTVAGAYAVGNVYSTGITNNGTQSGNLVFDVPMNAPDTLYYVCQNHSAMGGSIVMLTLPSSGASNTDTFNFSTDSIYDKRLLALNSNYGFDNVSGFINLTTGAGNTVTTVNLNTAVYVASTTNNYYKSYVLQIIQGTGVFASPNSALISSYNGTNKIATLATALGAVPDGTSRFKFYANSSTELGKAFSFETITLGKIKSLDLINGGAKFEESPQFDVVSLYETDFSTVVGDLIIPNGEFSFYNPANSTIQLRAANTSYETANGFYTGARLFVDVGTSSHYVDVVDYVVTDVATPSMIKLLKLSAPFEPVVTSTNIQNYRLRLDFRANVQGTGQIGVVEIVNGGSGYSPTDKLKFVGTGYGAKAAIKIVGGKIVDVSLIDRGEGYYESPTCIITDINDNPSSGSGAILRTIKLSDSEVFSAEVNRFGAIQSFDLINRGFDYNEAPNVSLKIVDVYSDNLYSVIATAPILSGDKVWQGGATNIDASFNGVIDEYDQVSGNSGIIRIYNYNGLLNVSQPLKVSTISQNVNLNIATYSGIISFNDVNPAIPRQYPYFYGDGLAKANAEFLSGLIKYDGFYLNTDGHVSSDKKIQDGKYYHNFSYEVQSEKSLNEYKETVERVAHPAGMQMWSKYILRNDIDETITTSSNVHISNTASTANCNTRFNTIFVSGNNSNFAATANVGDLIVINSDDPAVLRTYTKVITAIDPSQDRIAIESPVGGLSDGIIRLTSGNAFASIHNNAYPVHFSLKVGDAIGLPIGANNAIVARTVVEVSNSNNIIKLSSGTGIPNVNTTFQYNRSFVAVPYKIIRVNG